METGRLSVVATPIGNLEDITLRALRTLGEAEVIFCEDTRVTGKLLAHYEIVGKELVRADGEKEAAAAIAAAAYLHEGKHIAYVSDAGTPGISDPGARLVAHIRTELPEAVIEAIPGPSAVTAALSIAGIAETEYTFLGFPPHKKGRKTFFKNLTTYNYTVIFFESTHRIIKTLGTLVELSKTNSNVNITIRLGRELTKFHEEMLIGSPSELLARLEEEPMKQKGEFVVIVVPAGD